ncbi:hypothetical protein B188_27350 [Candidatus Brocadiaceae bacterium B188]|nr:hypothetical protein [Candidatus Brocadia sapporoensis]QQR65948.1 MAG: hypothetical protein IPI25_10375 [Candidatus Brocadia sp.]TWU50304.1 hypothetical protein B188_27350 [Candidatus Brocadiaceae bacterium B188]
MKHSHRMVILIFFILVAGCGNLSKPKLIDKEKNYGTEGESLSIFHRVAEGDGGLGLKFPGFIISIENACRENIKKDNIFESINDEYFHGNKEYQRSVYRILDDCKRMFISHLVEYRIDPYKGYIKEDIFYNAYDKCFDPTDAYLKGLLKLDELRNRIFINDSEAPYTHVFLYCMGWNTDQQESIRNYNSLFSQIIKENREGANFRPLFIGISWPSEWRSNFLGGFISVISYGAKADDADEVGLVWVNKILWDILVPVKETKHIPLIVVGHSFGARAVTRAVFSNGLITIPAGKRTLGIHPKKESDIDLVIGLQGAFSIRRFIQEDGEEGSPYSEFVKDKQVKKLVFTWSKYDFANPIAKFFTGASHIGGMYGHEVSLDHQDTFDHYKIEVESEPCNYDVLVKEVQRERGEKIKEEMKLEWNDSFQHPEKISIVDASELIKNKPYGKGGNAHSDIYTPGIANFMWNCIHNIENVRD